ncbi:MAG: Methionyl-tRNA formyltransferase [Microgenomates bacterium 39_7]|nr:MAG: Methionyl-tRNA formyltransferase [Microgenomates bacterium 39_7]
MTEEKISIAVAGSTQHAYEVTQSLKDDERFQLSWILTPRPKKVGRKQKLLTNPLHQWALELNVKYQLIDEKISHLDPELNKPDYLLVVDFGYIIPENLLAFPSNATINLHPSKLPAWRGSSPGQFVLLSGEKTSAISLIKVTSQLDAGPIIAQEEFEVEPHWTSAQYYQHSFAIASRLTPDWIDDHFQGKISESPQPTVSPTPLAKKINKSDAYIPWEILENFLAEKPDSKTHSPDNATSFLSESSIINYFLEQNSISNFAETIEKACRAFQPWPILWTIIPTIEGKKRVQILSCSVITKNGKQFLQINQVKVEGKDTTTWNEVKNIFN